MPRSDGKFGQKRPEAKYDRTSQYIPDALARRQAAFDQQKDTHGEKRPGSQRKGNSN